MSGRTRKPALVDGCVAELRDADVDDLPRVIRRHERDKRNGVKDAVRKARRRLRIHEAERERLLRMLDAQRELHERGLTVVAGTDEVGRGALAGPVSAGAVIMPADLVIDGINDSKLIERERREELAVEIRSRAVAWSVAHASHQEIDALGIGAASLLAMRRALDALSVPFDHALVDGNVPIPQTPCTPVVEGDRLVACIAAASIVAKVTRDTMMVDLSERYPGYSLHLNKGYTTEAHLEAIRTLGVSEIHRRSFAPCIQPRLF